MGARRPKKGRLEKIIGLNYYAYTVKLFRFPTFSPAERQAVHQEMRHRAGNAIQSGRTVIYDAATNAYAQRTDVVTLGHSLGIPTIGLWLHVPTELAMRRAGKLRDQGLIGPVARIIPPEIFMQYVNSFEAPRRDEDIVIISGEAPFALQYRRLRYELGRHDVRVPRMMQ
jgi:hypothetical protein